MSDAVGGYQPHEEWRTQALIVTHRASPEGAPGPGDLLLRITRNPLGALSDEEYARFCKARLAAVATLAGAARDHPELFCEVVASGRCDGGVFDVVPMPVARLEDIIERRVRCDPSSLHRALERLLDGVAAMHERAGRAHGALTPAAVFIDAPILQWSTGVRIGEPPAPAPPHDGPASDLRALGRIMHLLAERREPDPSVFSDEGDASAFRCFGRSGVRHRRLCADLLTASPSRADFGIEEARRQLRAIRPASPGARRAIRVGGAGVAVAAVVGVAATVWILNQPTEPMGTPPDTKQFDEARIFADLVLSDLRAGRTPALRERIDTPEFREAAAVLSVNELLDREDWSKWFSVERDRVERAISEYHQLMRWTESNVAAWEAAYEAAFAEVRARVIEPLREAAAAAGSQGWSEQAREATSLADASEDLIERAELESLAERVDDAAALQARIDGWLAALAEARSRTAPVVEDIGRSGAVVLFEGADEPTQAADLVRRWLDALAHAAPGEAPDATIARFEAQSAVVLERIADAADYWATNERFDDEQFIAEGVRLARANFDDAVEGRAAFEAWRTSVRDPDFVNIGDDPRIALAERREELLAERGRLVDRLTPEKLDLIDDRVAALDQQIASVEEPLEGLGEWSLENEQPIRDAVAVARSRVAAGLEQVESAEAFLEERANIEARRSGVIARAGELLQAEPGWFEQRLDPLIAEARVAEGDALEPALNALADETQRLSAAARDLDVLEATVASLRGDSGNFGDALRTRGQRLLDEWREAVVVDPTQADDLRAGIDGLVELRDRATATLALIDERSNPLTPEQTDAILGLSQALAEAGVVRQGADQHRLFQVLDQLSPYLETPGQWETLRDRLAIDMQAGGARMEVLWRAYEILRAAEDAVDPSLSIDDLELEQEIRARLADAYGGLPDPLASPALPDRLDAWLAERPRRWSANADIVADLAEVERLLTNAGAAGDAPPRIAGMRVLRDIIAYTPAEDAPDDQVRSLIQGFRARIADVRPQVPGDGDWYTVLSEVDRRLGELEAGRGGPRLDLELLASIGPAAAGWTLRPDSTVERPAYERGGATMAFVLLEDADPPFYLAADELSLQTFGVIVQNADAAQWSTITEHALFKDWGVTPDFLHRDGQPRAYFLTDQREIQLHEEWLTPPAVVRESVVDWDSHRTIMYGDDAGDAVEWAPSTTTPLHWIGFPGAIATAQSAGCRLPTPQEWLIAYERDALRSGASPNVSDAAWLRQVQRESRDVPSPDSGSFFAYGTGETAAAYQSESDGWLWLRPISAAPQEPAIRDLVGNVAEWADESALERAPDFAAAGMANDDLEAAARIMGVSAMSGDGEPDQAVALSARARRGGRQNLLADVRLGGGAGFADVGVRLAFGVGDAAPKSLAGRYAQTMEDIPSALADGEGGG